MRWMIRIELSEQVVAFVKSQAPEPRRWLRAALRRLAMEQGDIKALEGPLSGYYRLRVHGYRLIYSYDCSVKNERVIKCIFLERRNVIYEVFTAMLKKHLLEK